LFTAACDTADESGGRLQVLLTDAPLDDILEANITIERVEVMDDEEEPIVIMDESQDFDLLQLTNGLTADLVDISLDGVTFNQIRVVVGEDATLLLTDSTIETLKIPSGSTSGIKIKNLPEVTLGDSIDQVILTLDFDAESSFVKAGNSGKYIFKPVIKPLSMQIDGLMTEIPADSTSSDSTTTG
jgi:hypothetical protein